MLRVLPIVLALGLAIYALVDCVGTPDEQVRNLPKLAWIALIVLIQIVGPVAWLIAGRPKRNGGGRKKKPRIIPPDDDPDFLRKI